MTKGERYALFLILGTSRRVNWQGSIPCRAPFIGSLEGTMDDIVKKLRACAPYDPPYEMCDRAADEIERLRATLVQIRGFAHVMESHNWRDLQLHIERQCDVLDSGVQQTAR